MNIHILPNAQCIRIANVWSVNAYINTEVNSKLEFSAGYGEQVDYLVPVAASWTGKYNAIFAI